MLKVKTAVDIRDEWTAELRKPGTKLGLGTEDKHPCALQLLAMQLGLGQELWPRVGPKAGLTQHGVSQVYTMNDKLEVVRRQRWLLGFIPLGLFAVKDANGHWLFEPKHTPAQIADFIDTLPFTPSA